MKKHYETHVEDTDKLISVAGPVLDYKSWYERYRKLMEEQAQRKYGLYTPTSEGDDDFPSIPGMIARYSAKGLTNEEMSKNPVWVDKTGNGHDLQMKNFAWGGMSGCGGYSLSKETFSYTPDIYSFNFTDPEEGLKIFDVYFQLIGLEENSGVTFNLDIIESGTAKRIKRETYTKDGIYHFEYKSEDDATNLYMIGYNGVGEDRTTFTVKILPYYAGALVFDGVDDYGICDNFPILTKEKGYTVVALRQIISAKVSSVVSKFNASNTGAFLFEGYNLAGEYISGSFGTFVHDIEKSPFSYMTSVSYNGTSIKPGNKLDKSNMLAVGTFYNDFLKNFFGNIAIWELVILDHDATEEELQKIQDYYKQEYPWLFFDQAWTVTGKTNEDTDRATIANITGNGNNLVLSNFAFSGNSGYGLYFFNSLHSNLDTNANYTHIGYDQITLHNVKTEISSVHTLVKFVSAGQKIDYTIKISGLTALNEANPGFKIKNSQLRAGLALDVSSDGIYHIQGTIQESDYTFVTCILTYDNGNIPTDLDLNVTIEQIPDYEGYLVTDGVDDGISSLSVIENIKDFTWVGEFIFPQYTGSVNYVGIQKPNDFILYNYYNSANKIINAFIKGTTNNKLINKDTVKAVCSEGLVYDENWNSIVVPLSTNINMARVFSVGYNPLNNNYGKMIFKNIGRIPRKLSKEDMIKAYIYLQTLKAK